VAGSDANRVRAAPRRPRLRLFAGPG